MRCRYLLELLFFNIANKLVNGFENRKKNEFRRGNNCFRRGTTRYCDENRRRKRCRKKAQLQEFRFLWAWNGECFVSLRKTIFLLLCWYFFFFSFFHIFGCVLGRHLAYQENRTGVRFITRLHLPWNLIEIYVCWLKWFAASGGGQCKSQHVEWRKKSNKKSLRQLDVAMICKLISWINDERHTTIHDQSIAVI